MNAEGRATMEDMGPPLAERSLRRSRLRGRIGKVEEARDTLHDLLLELSDPLEVSASVHPQTVHFRLNLDSLPGHPAANADEVTLADVYTGLCGLVDELEDRLQELEGGVR